MRALLSLLALVIVAGVATAGDLPQADVPPAIRDACNLPYVMYDWDFSASNQGFTPVVCDQTGGAPCWAWGPTNIVGAPANVWGTVLMGNYPNSAGEGLLSPAFEVTASSNYLEVMNYFHCETNYDGGNVKVNDQVINPTNGYPRTISTSTGFYAFCVDMQQGWTGNSSSGPSQNWVPQCFDLTAFMGQTIQVRFDFGSDSSVSYPGWYIAYVKVGGEMPTPADASSWGRIKSLYR